ncbi:MAG: hypothetical protein K2W85_10715, partial [Phycisphaerales bacterium]|nr:hypothetical protein [Phycisphaerales bacterium]
MRARSVMANRGGWILNIAALSMSAGEVLGDVQFQVNAAPPAVGFTHAPPSIGMVWGGSGVGGNVHDAMVFSWPDTFLSAVAVPFCDRTCGTSSNFEVFGGGASLATRLYLRRFDAAGVAIDPTDLTLATSVAVRNGLFETPSIGVRPVNAGPGRENPFRVAWWDQWSWQFAGPLPCGMISCETQPVGWWTLRYTNFLDALPSAGSADFLSPAWCHGHRASVAFGPTTDLVAWRDVTGACSQILAGFGGQYAVPPTVPGSIVIRAGQADTQMDRPCAAWSMNGSFVVVWREDEFFSSSVRGRRVFADGSLGQVFDVANFRVAPNSAPAVSMFDDGSFVVQYVGFDNGDPPREPLLVTVFDAQEPPNAVVSEIEVEPEFRSYTNHTITTRGPSWPEPFTGVP